MLEYLGMIFMAFFYIGSVMFLSWFVHAEKIKELERKIEKLEKYIKEEDK